VESSHAFLVVEGALKKAVKKAASEMVEEAVVKGVS